MNKALNDKFVEDVRVLMADTEELLKATANQTGEKIAEARSKMQQAMSDLKPDLARWQTVVRDNAKVAASNADAYVRDNPWTMMGISAGLGLLIGLLIGRR